MHDLMDGRALFYTNPLRHSIPQTAEKRGRRGIRWTPGASRNRPKRKVYLFGSIETFPFVTVTLASIPAWRS